ncbi:MAG: alpha/beta fold hydrolase [Pseudomonadota bacterium]
MPSIESSLRLEQFAPFEPRGWLKNAHVQSILTSSPWRKWLVRRRSADYRARSVERILTTPDGVQLQGFRNDPIEPRHDGLAILLHGWEGSVDSNYLLDAAQALDQAGMATFRLNFRDHGDSHHLNEDLFHSCRLDEVLQAAAMLVAEHDRGPVFLVGFSLGGNFALRIARHAPSAGFGLDRVVAVSPVIRPQNAMAAMEQGLSVYEQYFVRKWSRSLKRKQALYPERYNLDQWLKHRNLSDQTRHLIEAYTDFEDLNSYFDGYAVAGDYLSDLTVSTTIITAEDDPIIPVGDFRHLPSPAAMTLEIWPYGGHCGFIQNWRCDSWIANRIVSELCKV